MPRITTDDAEVLAGMLAAEGEDDALDAGEKHDPEPQPEWLPLMNPVQREHWDDSSDIAGLCGPKFTGKTTVCLHVITRHCYLEWDALYWILGNNAAALAEGPCADLTKFVLPTWRDGNQAPPYIKRGGVLVPNPKAGEYLDNGIGLEYTMWKLDAQTKHPVLRIRNRFGGWSRIRVISIPHPDMIDARIRGPAPSGIYLEEATKCATNAYFTFPSLQLYRRRDITGPQQFQFTCNPEGKENWVFKWQYEEVLVPKDKPGRNWPKDPEQPDIRRDSGVSFRFVPYSDNEHNVSQKNREILARNLKNDPILKARLFDGKWIDYPSGLALFKDEFSESRHMHGDAEKNMGLLPAIGHPLVLGYDLGGRNVGTSIQQLIETPEGVAQVVVDELCYHQEKIASERLALALLEKIRFWNAWLREQLGWLAADHPGEAPPSWCVWHIAGDDATTVYRPNNDSVDAKDLQDKTAELIAANPERYAGIEPFRLRGCPRPPDSRKKRASLLAESLMASDPALFGCSQLCRWHRGMFFHLEEDPDDPGTPKKNKYLEAFDALTYPRLYRHLKLPGGFYDLNATGVVSVTV